MNSEAEMAPGMKDRHRRAVVAVFLAREHLPFIRHWCEHHLAQGWDVHLYDNSGSTGSARQSSVFAQGSLQRARIDKRGCHYGAFTQHLSDEEVGERLARELRDLPVKLTSWRPRDQSGAIVHGQTQAYADFILRNKGTTDWGMFIDCDEYLHCADGLVWDHIIKTMEAEQYYRALLKGIAYENRWTAAGEPRPLGELRSCGGQQTNPGVLQGCKNLVRLDQVERVDIHWMWHMNGRDRVCMLDPFQYGFRHYNQASFCFHTVLIDGFVKANQMADESAPISN